MEKQKIDETKTNTKMKKFIKILKFEYKRLFSDAGAVLIMLFAVFIYPLVYAIPYAHEILRDIPIAVLDFDNSKMSREFVRNVNASENLEIISRPLSQIQANKEFYSSKINGYVIIPKDFEKNIYKGEKAYVSMYADSAYLIVYRLINATLSTIGENLSTKIEVNKIMKEGYSKNNAISSAVPFKLVIEPLYNPTGGYESYIYPIVLLLILQQTLLVGIGLIGGTQRERKRIYSLKYPNITIFAKCACYISLYLPYSLVYLYLLPTLLKYKNSINFTTTIIVCLFLLAICLLGQTLVYFFKEREYSIMALASFGLPLLFLPGFIWPKLAIPAWLNFFAYFVPSTSTIDALVRLNQMDAAPIQVTKYVLILIILCCFYYTTAFLTYKRGLKE